MSDSGGNGVQTKVWLLDHEGIVHATGGRNRRSEREVSSVTLTDHTNG